MSEVAEKIKPPPQNVYSDDDYGDGCIALPVSPGVMYGCSGLRLLWRQAARSRGVGIFSGSVPRKYLLGIEFFVLGVMSDLRGYEVSPLNALLSRGYIEQGYGLVHASNNMHACTVCSTCKLT